MKICNERIRKLFLKNRMLYFDLNELTLIILFGIRSLSKKLRKLDKQSLLFYRKLSQQN